MKARNIVLVSVLVFATQMAFSQKVEVNVQESTITWYGKKVGGQHEGNILLSKGALELEKGQIKAGSFMIDMSSITCTDIENEEYNQKLVGHLKSDDFFGVEEFPGASMVLTGSSNFNNGLASVTADITIKGKTEKIIFDVQKEGNFYRANIELDRSKFDVRYGSKSFFNNLGDKAINDMFTLVIKLVINE